MKCDKFITFMVILCLLCQNICWAYGQDKLAKGAGCGDRELLGAAGTLSEVLTEAGRGGRVEVPPHLDAEGAVTDAIARGEISREMGERILRVLEEQGVDGLRKWYEKNKGSLTAATRMVFERLLVDRDISSLPKPDEFPTPPESKMPAFVFFGLPSGLLNMLGFLASQLWIEFGGWWGYRREIVAYVKIRLNLLSQRGFINDDGVLDGIVPFQSRLKGLKQWLWIILNQTYQLSFFIGQKIFRILGNILSSIVSHVNLKLKLQFDESRRGFVRNAGVLALGGVVLSLFGCGMRAVLRRPEPIVPVLTKPELIEELIRLAIEIEDPQARRYAVNFVRGFIRNGRLVVSYDEIKALKMFGTLARVETKDDSKTVYINYPEFRLLHPVFIQGVMVHEGRHLEDNPKIDRLKRDAGRIIDSLEEGMKGFEREDLINGDGSWKKIPGTDIYLYQVILLSVFLMVNSEANSYAAEYDFYRARLGDIEDYLEDFRSDRYMDSLYWWFMRKIREGNDNIALLGPRGIEQARMEGVVPASITWDEYVDYFFRKWLKELLDGNLSGAIESDGSLNKGKVRRNYLFRMFRNNLGLMKLVQIIENNRGINIQDQDRFLDWLDTGVFVDKDGTRTDLMGLDLSFSPHGAMLPIAAGGLRQTSDLVEGNPQMRLWGLHKSVISWWKHSVTGDWERFEREHDPEAESKAVSSFAELTRNEDVLIVGPGKGIEEIQEMFKAAPYLKRLVVLDISKDNLDYIRQELVKLPAEQRERVDIVEGDITKSSLEFDRFKIIYSHSVIDPEILKITGVDLAWEEVNRLLKDGDSLFLGHGIVPEHGKFPLQGIYSKQMKYTFSPDGRAEELNELIMLVARKRVVTGSSNTAVATAGMYTPEQHRIDGLSRVEIPVFSLGGNSLLTGAETRALDPTKEYDFEKIKAIQRANVRRTLVQLLPQIKDGGVITHGNGPEVGLLLYKKLGRPAGQKGDERYLAEIVEETQHWIGDDIRDVLIELGIPSDKIEVIITEVAVDPDDSAFLNPTKPIGPGPKTGPDNRVRVASPKPHKIVQLRQIRRAIASGKIVICVGGGGIPVSIHDFSVGMPAVIDKDFATALLVKELHETGPPVKRVVISTAEPCAYLNYGQPNQIPIHRATVTQIKHDIDEGHFAPGKMLPKIQAALEIVESGAVDEVVITSPEFISRIGESGIGTVIVRDPPAHSLWSNNKIERYVSGPGGIFSDYPDIQKRLRTAIGQGGPYTEWDNEKARIVINTNQKDFIDWYEREFGLISENKALTYHRAYVHELFHIWVRRVGFSNHLKKAFGSADGKVVTRFLDSFNRLFRVVPEINEQNLGILYEEIGAKYLSGLWEDPVVMIHPVYRIGNMWELINGAIEEADISIYSLMTKGVKKLEKALGKSVRHIDTKQDREFYTGLKRDIQVLHGGKARFHKDIEFAQRLSDLGVVEMNDKDGLKVSSVLMSWMRREVKRNNSRPEEVYIVVSNMRLRMDRKSGVITEITDSNFIEEYKNGRFNKRRRFEVLFDTKADIPVLKYAVFPVYGEHGLKSGKLTDFEQEYMMDFIDRPLRTEFHRIREKRYDAIPIRELELLAGMIANNLVRLQEASLRELANEGIIPKAALMGLLHRRPFDISELAGIVYNMVIDYRKSGFSRRDKEKLLARFIGVWRLGAFIQRHKKYSISKSDAINILFKYTWSEISPDDAVELAIRLQEQYGISRSDAFYFVSTYDKPEEALAKRIELARQIHGRHKVLKLKPTGENGRRAYMEQEVQVPFGDVFWFVKKYKAKEAEEKFVEALGIVKAHAVLGIPYSVGMFYVKTYGIEDAPDKLDEAYGQAERIQQEVNRGRQELVSISISDIMFFMMRYGPKRAESRIRKALKDIDRMMARYGISYRDAMRVAKGETQGNNYPAGGEGEVDYGELHFYGDNVVIEAGNYSEMVRLSRDYINGKIEKQAFIMELRKIITGDMMFKDFIAESLTEGLGQIRKSPDREILIQLLFQGIFGNRDNKGDIIIRRAKNLPANSSRYYFGGTVIIAFDSNFITALRTGLGGRKAGWLFCERLFHELYHKNVRGDQEEKRVTRGCDLILYEKIGQRVIDEVDLEVIKHRLLSGKYFRYLQFLLKQGPKGPLDGCTILRYADYYDSVGGVQTYLQDLNRILLERSNATIIQMYITYDENNSNVTEEQIGKGRLVKVPILVKKEDKEAVDLESRIYNMLKDFFNRIGIKTFLRNLLYRPWIGVLLNRVPIIRGFYNRRFMGLDREDIERKTGEIFERYKVDLAMFHSLDIIYSLGLPDMAKEKGIPVLIQHHSDNNFFDSYIGKRVASLADGVSGVNTVDVPKNIKSRFVNLSDGIDTEFFEPDLARPLELEFKEPVILLPARIEPDKGCLDIVKIAKILRDRYGIRVKIIFAGHEGLKGFIDVIERLAKKYSLSDAISFTGPLSQEELRNLYAVSSIVVLPSKTEGLPRVLLEAQAMGKPVVAYNVGGVSEAVCDCWAGSLIKIGDLNGFAIQLASLLGTIDGIGPTRERARRFVEERFSLKALAERHEKFYLKVLRSTNPAVATAGMYTRGQHDKMNKRIRSVIGEIEGVRVREARPAVWEALDEDTRQALEDVMLFLLPPEDPNYPYYLRVEGKEYQVAHAGSNRGEGRFIYMTKQAFMELPAELVARILKREVRLVGERFGYRQKNRRPNDVVYDDEVAGILREIPGPERNMYIYLKGKFRPAVVEKLVAEGIRLIGEGVLKGGATVEQLAEYLAILERNDLNPRRQGPIRLIYHKGAKFNIRDRHGKILGSIQDLIVLKQGTSVEGGTGYRHMKKHFLEFKGVSGEQGILDWLVRTIREGYVERYATSREGKGSLDVITFNLYREETEQAYRAVLSEDYSVMTFYPENYKDYGLSGILGISHIETLLLVKFITGRIPVTIKKSFSGLRGIQDLLAGYYRDKRGVLKKINRRIYFYPESGGHEACIGIWDSAEREMILMSLDWIVFDVLQMGVLAGRERVDITGKVGLIDSYLLRENEGGKRRFFRKDFQDTNTAIATQGMYTQEQHDKMNERIRGVVSGLMGVRVSGLAGVRVQDERPEVWEALDEDTRQALVDVILFLLPPEDPQYPYYLRVEGKEYQVAHAGTNQGQGQYIYMTRQVFMELPVELVGRILRREARLIGKRGIASYDEEVEAILLDIELASLQWNDTNRTRILLALVKKHNANLTLIRQELETRYGAKVDTETLWEWIYKDDTIAPIARRLRKLTDRFHSTWDVVWALQKRARQGQENTINALRHGPSKDWPLYFAVKHFSVELPVFAERYPTRHTVLEGLEERRRQGLINDWETLKRKREDPQLYRAAVRFKVFVPYKARAKIMQDIRLGFAEKEFYLAPELLGKVYIERGINEVRLVDMKDPSNWLGFSLRGGKIYVGEEELSLEKGREQHIEANPAVIEFVYEVLKRFYGKAKKEAILTYLKAQGIQVALDDRRLVMHRLWINLPRLYEESPGVVTAYRERDKLIRFYALVQTDDPDNYIIFVYKGGDVYIVEDGDDIKLEKTGRRVSPLKTDQFRIFDLRILRPTKEIIRAGTSAASLGQAIIGFSSSNIFQVERRRGAIYRREEWARDTIILKDVNTGEKVTEIERVGYDEFRIEGLEDSSGRPIIVVTNYINLSTLVWDFPEFSSDTLRRYFSRTDETGFGGPDRIVRYRCYPKSNTIIRDGYTPGRYYSVEKLHKRLPEEYRVLISCELLIQVVSSGRLPDEWPRLADLMVKRDVAENGEMVKEIGYAVEDAARYTELTVEKKRLIIEAIAVQALLCRGERLEADLDRLGYRTKRDEIIRRISEIRRRKREGKLSRIDYDFLMALEELLGYSRGIISFKVHSSKLKGKVDDRVERLKDIIELNLLQWEIGELARDKKPTGVIVQHIRDLGPGVANWLGGLKRYNVDMSNVRMAYVVDGVSPEDRKRLFASKPQNVVLVNSLEEIEEKSIVYLAGEGELQKVKRSGVVLVKREFGPVIDLSLCLLLLGTNDEEETRRIFRDEMEQIGILPKIEKVLQMWDELGEGATYLDVWA